MRIVHFSDLHLGFRQFQRQNPAGHNQREADVASTFVRVIDRIIEIAPDVVLVGGDVFHTVRPTNTSILHAFQQFQRLVTALPGTKVVMVAGNHDMPRSTDTMCILKLFSAPLGFEVADRDARRIRFDELGLSVLAVPDLPPGTIDLSPDPDSKFNVLLIHGEVQGTLPEAEVAETASRATARIPLAAVSNPGWDYVALGHYHVYRRVTDKAFYSGSIEFTSTNPWGELSKQKRSKLPGKGFIERDLTTGKQTFHAVKGARDFLDLPSIEAKGMSAADLDQQIRRSVDRVSGGVDGKVVRLTALNVPRHIARELDHKALREIQRRALHFHLDTQRPELVRPERGSGAPGRRPSLADTLRDALVARAVPAGVDRNALVALGLHYLEEAELSEPARDLPGADA